MHEKGWLGLESIDLESEESRVRLEQIHRYAQVGQCVGGVTHDINNLLGAAMAYAELASFDPKTSPETAKMLGQVVDGIGRCSHLISSLTSIARKNRPDINLASPERVMDEVLALRDYDLKIRQIAVEKVYGENLPVLPVDLPQLKLALLYLLMNAQEAVQDTADKRIKLSVGRTADGIFYEIWDSGAGLDADRLEHAFEPLRTYWPNTEHIGMGLYAARKIAELHEGELTYNRDAGFRLTIKRENGLLRQS